MNIKVKRKVRSRKRATGEISNWSLLGFGLWLASQAQRLPGRFDRAEPDRLLTDLTPYEHLLRIFRLCTIHYERNIDKYSDKDLQSPQVSGLQVREAMKSLSSPEPLADFDGTIRTIKLGSKKAKGTLSSIESMVHVLMSSLCFRLACR